MSLSKPFGLIATTLVATVVGVQQSNAYLQVYEGPTFNGTSGYTFPSFQQDSGASSTSPQAAWALLNDAGTAAWNSSLQPDNTYQALRFSPLLGSPVQLDDLATGASVSAFSVPYAINAAGTIVGNSRNSFNHDMPVRWSAGGTSPTFLQTLTTYLDFPPRPGQANDINDSEFAVGWSGRFHSTINLNLGDRAVRWDAAGNPMELGNISFQSTPCGESSCFIANAEAYAINNAGVAVGWGMAYGASDGHRGVRWDAAGNATQLGHLGSENSSSSANTISEAWAINEAGDAVGYARKYTQLGVYQGDRAVRWNHNTTAALELEVLGVDPNGSSTSKVYTLNEAGTAVGWVAKHDAQGASQGVRAVRWNAAGQVTELEGFNGFNGFSEAYDINNAGVAVGVADEESSSKAVYWDATGNLTDLNTLIAPNIGWRLTEALAISDTGWIAGIGKYDPDGDGGQFPYDRVFMLQLPHPVDPPGDYNDDDVVNAADYTLWRDNLGASLALPNDTTPGSVIAVDYEVWRANFGDTIGGGSLANVPEPATLILAAILLVVALSRKLLYTSRLGLTVAALFACSTAAAIDIETVLIGNANNPNDTRFMNDGTCCYGGVDYEYRIGKYEVTNDEYAVFLNAIAKNDTYEIYEPFMGSTYYGGILRSGGAPNYTYTVKPNMGDKPVLWVTNSRARRFANWLHNGQPTGSQTGATTENGAYDLSSETWYLRNAGATWFLPSEDEWYKAAYYDPRDVANGGIPGHYALYATGSIVQPTLATADAVGDISNPGVNTANYLQGANWNNSAPFGNVTTVGSAGPLSASYYGTFDQSGNINEFTENISTRGGRWDSLQDAISAQVRFGNAVFGYGGLRIASVLNPPNPNDDLDGDFNYDDVVNAADYTVWRDTMNNDSDGYNVWRSNFGATTGTGTATAIPEPGVLSLAFIAAMLFAMLRRSR